MCYVDITTVYLVFFPCPCLPSIQHIQVRLVRGETKLMYGALVVTDLYDFSTMTSECELLILTTPPKQRPFPSNIPQATASRRGSCRPPRQGVFLKTRWRLCYCFFLVSGLEYTQQHNSRREITQHTQQKNTPSVGRRLVSAHSRAANGNNPN